MERLNEGLSPRHCALSLVGEPIMYPEINALVDELHKRRISTFLVTNAQFPDKIKSLKPITQVLHHLEILNYARAGFVNASQTKLFLFRLAVICQCGCCNKGLFEGN